MLDSSRRLRMDGTTGAISAAVSISPDKLYAQLGTAAAPIVLDCRRPAEFDADNALIISAVRQVADAAPRGLRDLQVPYDIEGVEFSHEGERCSFDTIL